MIGTHSLGPTEDWGLAWVPDGIQAAEGQGMRPVHALGALALVMATPVMAWWMVGDLSEDVDRRYADYFLRPLELSSAVERGLGIGASIVAGMSCVVLVTATRRRTLDRAWWGVVVPVLLVGVFCGVAYRVMTAAVNGANIGAGFLILLGPILVIPPLTWANRTRLRISSTGHPAQCGHSKDHRS